MKLKLICILVSFLLILSCNTEPDFVSEPNDKEIDTNPPIELFSGSGVVPGKMMVKLAKEPTNTTNIVSTTRSGETIVTTGLNDIDRIVNLLGVKSMCRVFPHAGEFEQRTRDAGLHLWYVIEYDPDMPATRAVTGFFDSEEVSIVEPVFKVFPVGRGKLMTPASVADIAAAAAADKSTYATSSFNDPALISQWHYNNTGSVPKNGGGTTSTGFVAGADMRLFDAWKISVGDPEVIVCVVDGGVDYNHEDLKDNMWINPNERAGNNTDNDGNGYKNDVHGYNFVDNKGDIIAHSHGTHVAGTIAAVNNNGIGVCGVAGGNKSAGKKGARIMSCQIFKHRPSNPSKDDSCDDTMTAKAMKYGADNGAVISQNSWGWDAPGHYPAIIKEAVQYFIDYAGMKSGVQTGPMKGGVVIFSAGNENTTATTYPGADPNVVNVAAMAPNFKRAWYSNYNPGVNITAPGGDTDIPLPASAYRGVLSTMSGWNGSSIITNGYYYMDGTSMACPHVSGVAALAIATYGGISRPGFTPAMLKEKLLSNTYDIYSYNPSATGKLGTGALDATATLSSAIPPVNTSPIPDVSMRIWDPMKVITLSSHFTNMSGGALTYTASSSNASIIEVSVSGDKLTLANKGTGGVTITVVATSQKTSLSTTVTFKVTSLPNNPPKVTAQKMKDQEYSNFTEQSSFSVVDYFVDEDGDPLKYSVTTDVQGLVSLSLENNYLRITTLKSGKTKITVTATEDTPAGLSATQEFYVTCYDPSVPMNLYPSPATTTLNIKREELYGKSGTITVYSSSGAKVIEKTVELNFPEVYPLDVTKLTTGSYSLVLKYNGTTHKKNFLKK